MVLSEARGLWLFLVIRGGTEFYESERREETEQEQAESLDLVA